MYPAERVRWMLDDAGAAAVVSDATTSARLGAQWDRPAVVLEHGGEFSDNFAPDGDRPMARPPLPTDLAYVVYTSGSTGRPKGVLGGARRPGEPRRVASRGVRAECRRPLHSDLQPRIRRGGLGDLAQLGRRVPPSMSFPKALRTDPLGLRDWLVTEGITVTFVPTAVAEGIIGLDWPDDGALRYLLTGGDALTRRPPPDLGFTVVNNYGLSETTVVATSGAVAPDGEGAPSIGRPIAGVVARGRRRAPATGRPWRRR